MLTSQQPPETETELSALLVGTREAAYIDDIRCFDARESREADYRIGAYSRGDFGNIQGSRRYCRLSATGHGNNSNRKQMSW